MTAPFVRPGYARWMPYLYVAPFEAELTFLQKVFGAEVVERVRSSDSAIEHVDLRLLGTMLMMARAPSDEPPQRTSFYVYVENLEATIATALAAGATLQYPPTEMFYGDRNAGLVDPAGNRWVVATNLADLPRETIEQRATELLGVPVTVTRPR